ncbi:MAG: hypothetical protein MR867_02085 [Eubacterium sp.]|nr:hypothetical protein [Eubacterium sp.]
MIDRKDMDRQELIHQQVMEILSENLQFSNVARPKPTKASTATSAAWKKDEAPKASAATQGAWDSTNTPGGVSSLAKEKWTVQEIAAMITKVLTQNNVAFSNKPVPAPTKVSSSTQPAWKGDEECPKKPAAGTQGAWDTTDTPGGVSSEAKEVWNPSAIAALVTKVLKQNNVEFSNKPLPKPTTISSSTQPAWKGDEKECPKASASTQVVWKKDEPRKPSASTQAGWK